MAGAADTLFLPLIRGDIALEGRWLWLSAEPPATQLPPDLKDALDCIQQERSQFLALQDAGFHVARDASESAYQGALLLLGKHRGLNEANLLRASSMLPDGAPILIAGDKRSGLQPLKKRVGGPAEVVDTVSKHHAQVVHLRNTRALSAVLLQEEFSRVEGRFETAPGMFSYQHIDPASRMLAEHIDKRVGGRVADFGAGWGYLSAAVLERGNAESLDLYESWWPSLEAAMRNLAALAGAVPVTGHWFDLSREEIPRQYDWVVMNPPFHSGAERDVELGRSFIRRASAALKPGGRLLMVANVKLAYEDALSKAFRRVENLAERDGFKVLLAIR